jgi:hypothetical protein
VPIAARVAVAFAIVGMIALFLPVGEIAIGGSLAKVHSARSLFQLGKTTDGARQFLASYQASTRKKIGAKVLDKLAPHLPGRVRSAATDAQDAMSTLDAIDDHDVRTVGIAMTATMWTLFALNLLLVALLYNVDSRTSRLRLAGAAIIALLAASIAIAVLLIVRRVVAEANDAIGRPVYFSLRAAAYLLPFAAVTAAAATLVTIATRRRAGAPANATLRL